ncbi:Uncharacterised protein [Sphingobacterium multivorum]|uniref:hypothetical protein n=2 Tax=Sphingobacterium multivorum TaxID=28454 RepID=UPI000DFF6D49|nr:hypothetical protein [Sphingobacterium multivorum]SUJ25734.1 Uncharacterised protein [Sphingobacterium multivorum]
MDHNKNCLDFMKSIDSNRIFKDPKGKYAFFIPAKWKLSKKDAKDDQNTNQFQVNDTVMFRISCHKINDHIATIIKENKILPHDFRLPNISFVEKFIAKPEAIIYNWMAVVDDNFFMAVYFFSPGTMNEEDVGSDLMDVRTLLRNIIISGKEENLKKSHRETGKNNNSDFSDIQFWNYPTNRFLNDLGRKENPDINLVSSLKIDPVKLYALLTLKISQKPNGFFDLLRINKPLDNPIWWDFVLECPQGYIQIWRTPFLIEAKYQFDGDIDLELFFNSNIERYKDEIKSAIKNFDKHTIYINHYQSYRQCVETLWHEISEIDLTVPQTSKSHVSSEAELINYSKDLDRFLKNSVRYHALAKSLVLNAAFKIESFLNLIIRLGSIPEMRLYSDVLSKFLKQDFQSRIKSIRFYTRILKDDINVSSDIYRNTKELMTLRNKYVHYEEDPIHNRLGEIYYDRDYPLLSLAENRPAIESIKHTFHHPDLVTVHKAFETSNSFVTMIENLIHKEIKDDLLYLIQQNPIGYNESKNMYSAVYMPFAIDFFTGE